MSNFSFLACLELILLLLTLFRVKGWGSGDRSFFFIIFTWVEISLHFEFHSAGLPRSCRFMVGDKMLGRLY